MSNNCIVANPVILPPHITEIVESNTLDSRNIDPKRIFSSYANLQNFLETTPDIKKIEILAEQIDWIRFKTSTLFPPHLSSNGNAELAHLVGALQDVHTVEEYKTHLFVVAKMENNPNLLAERLKNWPPIPINFIPDSKVKKRISPINSFLSFNHEDGICSGICDAYSHVYFKTCHFFSNPREHMFAMGQLYKKGGGVDATLLQSINIRKGKILDLQIGTQSTHKKNLLPQPLIEKNVSNWRGSQLKKVGKQLQKLQPGLYRTGLPEHATLYLKSHNQLGYFIEPNHHILEINGPAQGKFLAHLMLYVFIRTKGDSCAYKNLTITPVYPR